MVSMQVHFMLDYLKYCSCLQIIDTYCQFRGDVFLLKQCFLTDVVSSLAEEKCFMSAAGLNITFNSIVDLAVGLNIMKQKSFTLEQYSNEYRRIIPESW